MPIFEYVCRECHHQFEALVFGSQKAACPKCESKKLDQQISRFAVSGTDKSSSFAAASPGPCGTCGDPRGPGSCSMNQVRAGIQAAFKLQQGGAGLQAAFKLQQGGAGLQPAFKLQQGGAGLQAAFKLQQGGAGLQPAFKLQQGGAGLQACI